MFIVKQVFTLDKSFTKSVREVHSARFVLTETGWGEFDLRFKVFFKCSKANPVTYWHRINIFPSKGDNIEIDENNIVVECNDEVVLPRPTKVLRKLLESVKSSEVNDFHTDFDQMEREVIQVLQKGSRIVGNENKDVNRKTEEMKRKDDILQSAWETHLKNVSEAQQMKNLNQGQLMENYLTIQQFERAIKKVDLD